ncbi:MAG TPA: hypothetical protein VMM76_21350 [Pirellulaceae bacterium]|nr:hypothetical protein [Pirellulaceae bacterium]
MMVSDQEYQEHEVFSELDRYIAFYERLAHSVFLWVSQGTGAVANIDSYVFSSIQGTLTSIQTILRDGRINDAYALLRKYHDSAIINIYSNLYLEEHFGIDNFIVTQIDDWLKGKSQLPEYRIMSQYIRSSVRVAPVTAALLADDRYTQIRSRCNDHTHYNFYRNVLLNDNELLLRNRGRALEVFSTDLRNLFILHVAYMLCAREHYMMSSDYRDALECNMTPEPDSEYWVAPFVQDAFDLTVVRHRPDIATIIKNQTSMHLA